MKNIVIYAASWLGMALLAILNGAAREQIYGQLVSELTAHQLSTFIGLILFAFYIWILTGLCRIASAKQALVIGGMWLIMTVAFEFVFGHYIVGHPWPILLADYNLGKGRMWPVLLMWTALAPYLFFRIRTY